MKSVDELLKSRYKVIADYPGNIFDEDEIFFVNRDEEFIYEIPTGLGCIQPFMYPHIFKRLGWWEERQVEDMPMYLKQTDMVDSADNPIPDWYVKVKKHFNAGNGEWRDNSIEIFCIEKCERTIGTSMSYAGFLPATEADYLTYKSQST